MPTLYIDCFPIVSPSGNTVVDAAAWLAPLTDAVAKANNVSDWREIPYTSKGLLASAIRRAFSEKKVPEYMAVNSALAGSDVIIEVLGPKTPHVVKGLR